MALPEGGNNFVDQNNCPPKLEVKLKWKASEWQDRAKTYNTDSFAKNGPKIKAIQVSAESLLASSTLNGIIINADDQSIINYIRTLSADKPVNIVNMQKVLKDECDKTIAIDGRVGDQTIAAMESIIKRIATIVNKQIPGYSEALAVVSKIDAAMAPVIDLPSTKIKPAQWSPEKGAEQIQKNMNTARTLLQEHYKATGATINEKWMLFVRKDVQGNSDTQLQQIATIDLSKSEDTVWDNIRFVLEEYKQKINITASTPNQPTALSTDKPDSVNKPNQIDGKTEQDKKIQLSPEQTNEVQWKQIQSGIITYATSQWCEVTFMKTGKIAKDIRWVDNTNKDGLALNQFYEMKITKNRKQIGSKEFTLGTDNIVTDKPGSDKINPNLTNKLKGYIDSANLEWAFVEKNETINGVEVSSDAMNEFKKLGISLKKSDRSRYLIDMNFTDGKVFQLITNGKTQRMGRENGILNQGGLDNTTQKVEYKNGTFVLTDKKSGESTFTIQEITQSPTVNTEVSSDSIEKIETDWNKVMNQVKEYAKTQWVNLKMEKTGIAVKSLSKPTFNPLEVYNVFVQKNSQSKWEKIGTSYPVHLEWKVDIQRKVNEIKALIDNHAQSEAVKPQEVTQEAVNKAWYDGFKQAVNYAQTKWYILTNQASEFTAKGWDMSRPDIDKGKLQTLALVNKNTKEIRELWTISVEKIHLVSIQTPQEIRDEIQKKIDESLARKMAESQENKTRTENIIKIDALLQKMWYSLDYVDGWSGRMYKNQNNERLQVFWWFFWVPKDHTLTNSEIRYNLLQSNKQEGLQQQIDNAMNGNISPEKNEQWSEKISISEQALSEYKKLGITLIKEGNGMRGDFDQNKHFISVETSFDKSGKFIKIEKWPVSKKEWEELLIDQKTKSVTFENGAFTVIDKNGSKMTSVLTEVKNQPMDQEMINNFKDNAPSSVQVLSATDSEIKLKTMTQNNTMRSLSAKSTIETWFDATLWEITFSATKEDPFTKMVWEKQIPKSLIPELRSQGFPIGNSIPTVARIESRLWDNVMVIPHPDGKGFATVCKVGGVHVYNKDNTNPGTVFARKPVIYLYPTEKTKISVSVELSGADMITEYPRTANGTWKVEASPKGNLVDMYDKKKYSYLFWEAAKHTSFTLNPENMDCIASIDIQNYLEKSLKTLGLNAREMNDFMVYWLPILEQNPYSLIEWKTTEYTDMAKLHISPKPEILIRIFMVFKWSEQIVATKNVELQKTRRKGYSVVEWGGCNLDEKNNIK